MLHVLRRCRCKNQIDLCLTRIKEHSPRAIYIHCFADRLNLVVVDVAGAIGHVGGMFAVLQRMHNLLSTTVVHARFVAPQKTIYHDSRVWEISSLSDTCWVCRHDAVLSGQGHSWQLSQPLITSLMRVVIGETTQEYFSSWLTRAL